MKTIKFISLFILVTSSAIAQEDSIINSLRMPQFDPSNMIFDYYYAPDTTDIPTQGNGSFFNGFSTTATDLTDIHVHTESNPQSEPHLSINKHNPNNIVISANYYNSGSCNGYNQSIYVNNNFNYSSWNAFLCFPNASTTDGDPSTAPDEDGNLFVATINSSDNSYWVDKSTNLGVGWTGPVSGNAASNTFDKEMIDVDNLPYSSYENYVYSAWTDFATSGWPVKFNRSTNNGSSYSTPIIISTRFGQGTNVQTGPNGEVYVCWADYGPSATLPGQNIAFTKSVNGGSGFSTAAFPISYTGIRTSNGALSQFNNTRVNDFPSMAVDRSCGSYRGRIYITYAENIGGKSRVRVKYSTNQGSSFADCNTNGIVDINGVQNWMPWVAVDDASGLVCVAYLTASTGPTTFYTDTYLAYSDNGGNTFSNIKVSDVHHTHSPIAGPFASGYCGDYIGVDAYEGNAYVAWNDNRSGNWNIYCSTVKFSSPLFVSSQQDMDLNGPMNWGSGNGSVLYEAVHSITCTANQQQFNIGNSANVTFKAGSFIHFTPGFGSASGSLTHAYISPVTACSSPFRLADNFQSPEDNPANAEINLSAYPNPFFSNFDLNYTVFKNEIVNLNLFNSFGQVVLNISNAKIQEAGKYNVKVDVHGLPSGIYYINLQTATENYVKKIIKL